MFTKIKFQFFNCALIEKWRSFDGQVHEHLEVHFALFGRDISNNEVIAVTLRYCPSIMVADLAKSNLIRYSHYDKLQKTPLYGYTEEKMTVYRLYVPHRSEFERIKRAYKDNELEILDPHQTLEQQLMLVLQLKPLDVITLDKSSLQLAAGINKHTSVVREYHIPVRLVVGNRKDFPLVVAHNSELVTKPTVLSFDVEAYSNNGEFTKPGNSKTICICYSVCSVDGKPIADGKLVLQDTEKNLLLNYLSSKQPSPSTTQI